MEKIRKLIGAIALLLMLPGCYPINPEEIDQSDIVFTNSDAEFDFGNVHTFALPAQVILIGCQDFRPREGAGTPEFADSGRAAAVLGAIRDNLAYLGWTEVGKDEAPDVILLVSVSATSQVYYHYDWDYWHWWYPGWYSGRHWHYPDYHPPYRNYHHAGTLFIQMVDAKRPGDDPALHVVWSALVNGAMDGTPGQADVRIKKAIDQAFKQSLFRT